MSLGKPNVPHSPLAISCNYLAPILFLELIVIYTQNKLYKIKL